MLRRSWQAGLQLVVAIRIATAAVLDRSATRLLNGLYQLRGEKTWVAEATEELAGRQQLRAEVSQMISGCSEKK